MKKQSSGPIMNKESGSDEDCICFCLIVGFPLNWTNDVGRPSILLNTHLMQNGLNVQFDFFVPWMLRIFRAGFVLPRFFHTMYPAHPSYSIFCIDPGSNKNNYKVPVSVMLSFYACQQKNIYSIFVEKKPQSRRLTRDEPRKLPSQPFD